MNEHIEQARREHEAALAIEQAAELRLRHLRPGTETYKRRKQTLDRARLEVIKTSRIYAALLDQHTSMQAG